MVELPDFLTVEEVQAILRIGRTVAYRQLQRYEATGGAEGIPCERVGNQYLIPRAKLELLAGGRLTGTSLQHPASPAPEPQPQLPNPTTAAARRSRAKSKTVITAQATLPLD